MGYDATQEISAHPMISALTGNGPSVVIGAPGSGKTTLAIQHIESLVHDQNYHPDQVRLLLPTRNQATSLRDHLGLTLGKSTRGPLAMSIQAFAFDVVRGERERHGEPPPRLRSGADVDADIRSLLDEQASGSDGPAWPEHLSGEVRQTETFRTELRELIARVTELGLGADDLRRWSGAHPAWMAVANFLDDYRRVIARSRPDEFDPAELIRLATAVVEAEGLGTRGLRAVVVDNYQDMSPATAGLLCALHNQGIHLVVLAEPDIAGQTFRGADPEGAVRLARSLSVQPIILDTVYRHGPAIRASVTALTSRVGTALAGAQRRATALGQEDTPALVAVRSPSPSREAHDIARLLGRHHREGGIDYASMAVVVRRSGAVPVIAQVLHQAGIPTETDTRTSLSGHPATRELIGWIRLAHTPEVVSAEAISELLSGVYAGLHRRDIRRLGMTLRSIDQLEGVFRSAKESLAEVIRSGVVPASLPEYWHRPLGRVVGVISALRSLPEATTADVLTSRAWELWAVEDDWVARATNPARPSSFARESINQVGALLRTAERYVKTHPGASPMVFFDQVLGSEVTEDVLMPATERLGVTIATPAQVAGMEFDVVAVAGLNERVWPNTRIRGSLLGAPLVIRAVRNQLDEPIDEQRAVIDDELRMAALAVSRAKQVVIVSCVDADDEQPSPLFHILADGATLEPSSGEEFGSSREMVGHLRRHLLEGDTSAAEALAYLASRGVAGADPDQWWGLAEPTTSQALFSDGPTPVSPSKISKVEESALDWFLDRIAPEDLPPSVGMGSLLHHALEHAPWGTEQELRDLVTTRFSELDFEAGWQASAGHRQAMGLVVALADYLSDRAKAGVEISAIEQRFTVELDGAILVGVIDRVEKEASGELVVVDLKTGRPISDNQVVTDPQLSAYQLALHDSTLRDELTTEAGVAGAWLLFVKEGKAGKRYRVAAQETLGAAELSEFRERVTTIASLMAASSFEGPREKSFAGNNAPEHRWQRVGAVCGDE